MNKVFEKFVKKFNSNEICYINRKPNNFEIVVIAKEEQFDSWYHLKRINKLFLLHGNPSK